MKLDLKLPGDDMADEVVGNQTDTAKADEAKGMHGKLLKKALAGEDGEAIEEALRSCLDSVP